MEKSKCFAEKLEMARGLKEKGCLVLECCQKGPNAARRTLTSTYQDAVTMGTHRRTEPLTGLELHLSVHIVYIKIAITWKREKGKKPEARQFLRSLKNKPHV